MPRRLDPINDPERYLRQVIRLARRLERRMPPEKLRRLKPFIGYGFLVRNRRLAEAIDRLGVPFAYEGRMLLRSMIEIQINYGWISADRRHSRALRFMRFEPIERLQITLDIQSILSPEKAAQTLQRFRKERTDTRHLFRQTAGPKGKRVWAAHWARVSALRDRFVELLKREGQSGADLFTYGLYRWASSAVHGGPLSISEVLVTNARGARAKKQPEPAPRAQLTAAAVTLLTTVVTLVRSTRTIRLLQPEIGALHAAFKASVKKTRERSAA